MKTLIICIVIFYVLPLICCIRNYREFFSEEFHREEMEGSDILATICPVYNFSITLMILWWKLSNYVDDRAERFFK